MTFSVTMASGPAAPIVFILRDEAMAYLSVEQAEALVPHLFDFIAAKIKTSSNIARGLSIAVLAPQSNESLDLPVRLSWWGTGSSDYAVMSANIDFQLSELPSLLHGVRMALQQIDPVKYADPEPPAPDARLFPLQPEEIIGATLDHIATMNSARATTDGVRAHLRRLVGMEGSRPTMRDRMLFRWLNEHPEAAVMFEAIMEMADIDARNAKWNARTSDIEGQGAP